MTLVGRGSGTKSVLGWAVNVSYLGRRPVISERTMAMLRKSVDVEAVRLDIVLIVDRIDIGLWMPLPMESTLVGIVTTQGFPKDMENPLDIPSVHVETLPAEAIEDAMLVLVDPLRNRVLVEPTAEELVRIQLNSSVRYAISSEDIPVQTRGGVPIAIYAQIETEADVILAHAAGAEGLVICGPVDHALWHTAALCALPLWVEAPLLEILNETGTTGRIARYGPDWDAPERFQDCVNTHIATKGLVAHPKRICDLRQPTETRSAEGADTLLCRMDTIPLDVLSMPPIWTELDHVQDAVHAVLAGSSGIVIRAAYVAEVKHLLRNQVSEE